MKEFRLEYYSQKLSIWDYLNVAIKAALYGFGAFVLFFMSPFIFAFFSSGRRRHHISEKEMKFLQYVFKTHHQLWQEYGLFFFFMILVIALFFLLRKKYYSRIFITDELVRVEYFVLFFGKREMQFQRPNLKCEIQYPRMNLIADIKLIIFEDAKKVSISLMQNPWSENKFKSKFFEIEKILNQKV